MARTSSPRLGAGTVRHRAWAIENAKPIELVSRREMPLAFARRLYALYGLEFAPDNPRHSAPLYSYFLPAQAAHVIRTSTLHGP
jgi:hypothetical protein